VNTPKHVFRVLAWLSARHGLVVALLGALVIGILPNLPAAGGPGVNIDATPTAAGPWLSRLNAWRANVGLPNLTENATWSAGDYNHSLYMVKNNEVTHSEIPGHPYYTTAGDTASRNGNIQVSGSTSSTDSQAIDWWMAAPFHAISMMDPLLASTGFGAYRQANTVWKAGFTLDTSRGRLSSGGKYPVYYPGNGTTEPLRTFGGGEWPDPLQACSGYSAPTGLPVIIQVGSNVDTTASAVHSFTGNGVALQHCVIDSRNAALGSSLKWHGGVILIPKAPLQNGVKYVVSLTVNAKPYTWSFTVGSSLTAQVAVTGVSPNNGPLAGGTAVTISGRGFSGGVTGVMFGAAPAASFSLVDDATVTAVSPAHAGGTVDVTVITAGGSTNISNSDHFSYGACTSATASAAPASPSPAGTVVTITGAGSGCTSPLYEFWLQWINGTWHMMKAFGDPTWNWDTSGYAPGTYTIHVWANNTGDSQTAFEVFGTVTYTVLSNKCVSAGLTVTGLATRPAGTAVAFTAASSVCPSPTYEFWVGDAAGHWTLKRPFAGDPSWTWDTTGLAPGVYDVHVWANNAGNATKTWESLASSLITLTGCTSATVSPLSGSGSVGSQVAFTVTSTSGCPSPVYEPWLQYPDGTWHKMRSFSSSNAWTWTTTGFPKGQYVLHFWANNQGSYYGALQTFGTSTYTLT
jgi:IPT/TIG domain-containing protein/cysteine-rich secretory family protein